MADWLGVDVAKPTCTIDGCERPNNAHGWCLPHYKRWQKYGDPLGSPPRKTQCAVEGCDRPWRSRDWCYMHYQRWQKCGDPLYERKPTLCVIPGCGVRATARGWCSMHYTRWRRYGSPTFRVAGEVVNGRRVCPGCKVDKALSDYSATTGRCKDCLAAERRVARLADTRVPLPSVHCIVCADLFIPRTNRNYCCSPECTDARKCAMDSYYGQVDGHLEARRRWRKNNPDRHIEIQGRRRSRKEQSQVIRLTREMISGRMAYFGNKCWMCGGAFECVDHVKPISRGGPHILANLRPACNRCNIAKSNKWEGVPALRALAA